MPAPLRPSPRPDSRSSGRSNHPSLNSPASRCRYRHAPPAHPASWTRGLSIHRSSEPSLARLLAPRRRAMDDSSWCSRTPVGYPRPSTEHVPSNMSSQTCDDHASPRARCKTQPSLGLTNSACEFASRRCPRKSTGSRSTASYISRHHARSHRSTSRPRDARGLPVTRGCRPRTRAPLSPPASPTTGPPTIRSSTPARRWPAGPRPAPQPAQRAR